MTTEALSTYSRALSGKVKSILDNSTLALVGGNFDGQVAKSSHFVQSLPLFPLDIRPEEAGRLNVRFPKFLEALLLSNLLSAKESQRLAGNAYVEALGGEDFGNIAHLAMRTATLEAKTKPEDPQAVIRVVYGGTNQMPLRGLSGLLPALVYMENLQDSGMTVPQLQLIFADHISAGANPHIGFARAIEESTRFAKIAGKYVDVFFPRLKPHIAMLRDTPVEPGALLAQELEEVSPITDEFISEKTRQALARKGNGNGSEIYYGSAHLLAHDISLPGVFAPIIEGQTTLIDPQVIISIGGRQERDFYKLRHEVKPHLPKRYRQAVTFQLFTKHQVPPYYMARDGDLKLGQRVDFRKIGELEGIGDATRYDLAYLVKTSLSRSDLQDFFEREINSGTIL